MSPCDHRPGGESERGRNDERLRIFPFPSSIDRDLSVFEDDEFNLFNRGAAPNDDFFFAREQPGGNLRWKSPLESVAALPSLSLGSQQPVSPTVFAESILPGSLHIVPHRSHSTIIEQSRQPIQPRIKLKTRSTGTTITALLAQNNTVLILTADTRATDGSTVADKRCEKLHRLAKSVWCAGAGTSADVEALVRKTRFVFWRRSLLTGEGLGIGNLGRKISFENVGLIGLDGMAAEDGREGDLPSASVPAILHYLRTQLQQYQGAVGVNLLVGGYDPQSHRAALAAIHPHGSTDVVTYAALGSGGLAATGVLEDKYPKIGDVCCSVEEGIRLAVDAVKAAIDNDLGGGSQVDVCVVGREGVVYRRGVVSEETLDWLGSKEEEEHISVDKQGLSRKMRASYDNIVTTGVNGFGNVPFAVYSHRVVIDGEGVAE